VGSETAELRNDAADNVHFSGVNSHRTRPGGRYIYQATSAASVYASLAWEHEFDAKSKSSVSYAASTYGAGVPELKGSSAMGEPGVRITPSEFTPLNIATWV